MVLPLQVPESNVLSPPAEADLFAPGALPPLLKEYVALVVAAASGNLYRTARHCHRLRALGVPREHAEQVALDHRHAALPQAEHALLDACLKLARSPGAFLPADRDLLRAHGLSHLQIDEAAMLTATVTVFNAQEAGLRPESPLDITLPAGPAYPLPPIPRNEPEPDPDAGCVARVQAGDTAAFEELVRRHGVRVQRTLAGILGHGPDLEDAVQDCFLNAFQHIADFQHRSRFSTWLTRIAVNTALQRRRSFKPTLSLDDDRQSSGAPPPQLRSWRDDPEQACSKEQMRSRVIDAILGLPAQYRMVVMLRDLHQRSTAETAEALDLQIPAVKSRLFRGRMLLREALAPYFARNGSEES